MTSGNPAPRRGRRLPLWTHLVPLLVGLAILIVGFVWFDPLWPAQDMPPAIAERYRRAAARVDAIYAVGGWTTAAGALWFTGALLRRLLRRRAASKADGAPATDQASER